MKSISERIREALEIRGMKQADLVKITGIGKSSISTYLSGAYEPKQRNIYKIARALNVNEAWLMGYDVSMERSSVSQVNDSPLIKAFLNSDDDIPLLKGLINNRLTDGINFEPIDIELLRTFKSLNKTGKAEALKRIRELSFIPDYCQSTLSFNTLDAAHEIEDTSEEDKKHDDDIMNDDDFWK